MSTQLESAEEREDLKRRKELQQKLQDAIRRSASQSEIQTITQQIEKLNTKLEAYSNRLRKIPVS